MRGQHNRFRQRAVIILAKINGVLGQPVQHRLGHGGHPRFGISAGSRVIAVDIAKVALTINQRIAHVKVLRQTRHRVVNRSIAMRVIVAHHIAADLGRLAKAPIRGKAQFAHRIEDSAVNRLETVTRVRQGAVHNCRKRIGQIAIAQRAAQRLGHLFGVHVGGITGI